MKITASVKKSDANYKAVMEAIEFIKKQEVYIGIPENTVGRKNSKDTPVNNADLLFIHTNGSPKKNIPPRPVLEPAIIKNKEQISVALKKAIDAAVSGNIEAIMPLLEEAGNEGVSAVQRFFKDPANGWEPNRPETVAMKTPAIRNLRARARNAKKPETRKKLYAQAREAAKNTKANPLIDIEEMRKAISYIVREAGKK